MKRISWTLLAVAAMAFSTCLPAQAGGGFGRRGRPDVPQQEKQEKQEKKEKQEPRPDARAPERQRQGRRNGQVPVEELRQQLRQRIMHFRMQAERLQQLRQHAGRGERPQMGRRESMRGGPQAGRQQGFGGGRGRELQGEGPRHRMNAAGPGFRGGRGQAGFRGGRGAQMPPAFAGRGPAGGRQMPPAVREQSRQRLQQPAENFRKQEAGRRGRGRPEAGPGPARRGRQLEA